MKTIIMILICLIPFQLQASCKCNCKFTDLTICASSYDLDNPCPGLCPAAAPGIAPMKTACPPTMVYNPITQQQELKVICTQ
ncbi:hypothetical protein [Legionella bononiensis]|uniref:Uncharacterized protein n=1 Tax=Legionella bononiensis TaxID=2793102 RepID=A0ABS1W755_9GAMM|nr:hypothetical protein [Legionella bononiensis]MBL7481288.1 hypothetical protein [Legionella bononiensis]MBL7525192.1 hypothetical protein [Legionella bononiensis]MBL7561375.1 hypothetical protein [Legionella bononiensis]